MRVVHLVLRPRVPILSTRLPLNSLPCISNIQPRTSLSRRGCHPYSTAVNSPEDGFHLLSSEATTPPQRLSEPYTKRASDVALIQATKLFGKWAPLLTNPQRLAIESDFFRRGPSTRWKGELLVDRSENYGDIALWACLLDYQKRVNGDLGVHNVWKGLWGRKSLHHVQHPLGPTFFRVVLEAALNLSDQKFLEDIWVYSEWMYDLHRVKWPLLYSTVMGHLLRKRRHREVLQWQLRLTPNFYPGPVEFADLIRQFSSDPELYEYSALESLYHINPDHCLYDTLVPHLYGNGQSQLARTWRRTCVLHSDLPQAPMAVRPFLRFLQGYHPYDDLHPTEAAAIEFAHSEPNVNVETDNPRLSREYVNLVHGKTFGISVKSYNDKLGAKWFASSWLGLDTAISTVSSLGIQQIGPLSLQSIALREEGAEGVLSRIAQLQQKGISIIDSTYVRMVRQFAESRDEELLSNLLHSDIHPDVFDDMELQARLLACPADPFDWKSHRLLMAAKIITTKQAVRAAANAILRARFLEKDLQGILKILDDMKAIGSEVNHEEVELIYQSLFNEADRYESSRDLLSFYFTICQRLTMMEFPVSIGTWRLLLFRYIRGGLLEDVEKLCLYLVAQFTTIQSSRPGFVPVHINDVPEITRKPLLGVPNLMGIYLPLDLPRKNTNHPLALIFDRKLLRTMIRYSFITAHKRSMFSAPPLQRNREQPQAFHYGHAVRLLKILKDRGLPVDHKMVAKYVKDHFVTIYGVGLFSKQNLSLMRSRNMLPLQDMKDLMDSAWGRELLPSVADLSTEILERSRARSRENKRYIRVRNRTIISQTPQTA